MISFLVLNQGSGVFTADFFDHLILTVRSAGLPGGYCLPCWLDVCASHTTPCGVWWGKSLGWEIQYCWNWLTVLLELLDRSIELETHKLVPNCSSKNRLNIGGCWIAPFWPIFSDIHPWILHTLVQNYKRTSKYLNFCWRMVIPMTHVYFLPLFAF